jgi:hypothetical protein
MKKDSGHIHGGRPRIWILITVSAVVFVAAGSPFAPSLNAAPQAETVTYCQLLKSPNAYDGKLIRITGVYRYSFETQRLFPSRCCEDLDPKMWVALGELDRKSRKLVHRFPEGTGMVLGTFVGRLDYGHSPNPQGAQFTLTITAVESVERVTTEIEKVAWAPPFCKQ